MSELLKLKVRHIPCLCPPCIFDDGQMCHNHPYTDSWRTVDLIPTKGGSKKKYEKRKRPDSDVRQVNEEEIAAESSDDDLPEITFEVPETEKVNKSGHVIAEPTKKEAVTDTVTDEVTEMANTTECAEKREWCSVAEEITDKDFLSSSGSSSEEISNQVEMINLCQDSSEELRMSSDNFFMNDAAPQPQKSLQLDKSTIPDEIYWHSILTAFDSCQDFQQLVDLVKQMHAKGLRPLAKRNPGVYDPEVDKLDYVAQKEIPHDGPTNLKAVFTVGD